MGRLVLVCVEEENYSRSVLSIKAVLTSKKPPIRFGQWAVATDKSSILKMVVEEPNIHNS